MELKLVSGPHHNHCRRVTKPVIIEGEFAGCSVFGELVGDASFKTKGTGKSVAGVKLRIEAAPVAGPN